MSMAMAKAKAANDIFFIIGFLDSFIDLDIGHLSFSKDRALACFIANTRSATNEVFRGGTFSKVIATT
jgi:hypothetical protein